MKYTIVMLALVFSAFSGYTQVDCKPYCPNKEGSKWEITSYSAKGKATGKTAYELVEKVESGDEITFTINNVSYDKKDKEIYRNSYTAKCANGKFDLNMAMRMDGATMQSYENMDVQVDASDFEIPTMDEPVGTSLEDGTLKVAMSAGGAMGLNMTVHVTDRKIEAKEAITTPAGKFDCILLSQKVSTRMLLSIETTSKEWYAEGVGMVRSESYNKNGKMMGYTELTLLQGN